MSVPGAGDSIHPTGSYKDRMALAMITEAERRGDLTSGMTVVEYTGGSTGSSLAYVCAAKGYRFRVVACVRRRETQDDAGVRSRSHDHRPIDPASTAVISGGAPGTHGVEGTGIGFVPPLLDADGYDEVRTIDEAPK